MRPPHYLATKEARALILSQFILGCDRSADQIGVGGRIVTAHRRPPEIFADSRDDSFLAFRVKIHLRLPRELRLYLHPRRKNITGRRFVSRAQNLYNTNALPMRRLSFYPRLCFFSGTPTTWSWAIGRCKHFPVL